MGWFNDHKNLAQMAELMEDAGWTVREIIRFLEKPWKWTSEWERVERGENPFDDDE